MRGKRGEEIALIRSAKERHILQIYFSGRVRTTARGFIRNNFVY